MAAKGKDPKVTINRKHWDYLLEDQQARRVFLRNLTLNQELEYIIEETFPQRIREVKKLINGINMVQKARLAYILGLIDKIVFNDLKQLHAVRNIFAHSHTASFTNIKVLKFVRKLSIAKGQEVTEKNSYKFYEDAELTCVNHITDVHAKRSQKLSDVYAKRKSKA